MEKKEIEKIIDQLRKQEIDSYIVKKEDFSHFRAELVRQEDLNDFRGMAKHRGETIFTYEPGWTK